jgi:hypothetical protein
MEDIKSIITCIDEFLEKESLIEVSPPNVSEYLEQKGVLNDSSKRKGKPLRDLLRANEIPHAYQNGSRWFIPHSNETKKVDGHIIEETKLRVKKVRSIKEVNGGKHKLKIIAETIRAKLRDHYGEEVKYTLEYKPEWLQGFPSAVKKSGFWPNICKAYSQLNEIKLDLETQLESYTQSSRAQSYDIWFHEPANFAVEFDEKQHFNQFRKSTLEHYNKTPINFDLQTYKELCCRVVKPGKSYFQKTKKNNDLFPYQGDSEAQDNRIRQRAFRDMLKDIYPLVMGFNGTFRIPYQFVTNKIKDFNEDDLRLVEQIVSKALVTIGTQNSNGAK